MLVAVDVGTSGARASGFDVSGAALDEVRRSYPTYLPSEGWAEQDARRWRSAALSALGALVRSLGPRGRVRAQAVTESPPGAGGLVFAPVLGDGERDDPALRGAVTGMSLRHDRGAIARAALEGIACGVRARLATLGRTSAPATELRVSGGGAGMAVWNQIKADVTGIPVVRVAGDSTAAGAAMLAGLGAGLYAAAAEAVTAGYRPLSPAEPDPAHRARYDDLYQRYQALLESRVVR